MVFNIILNKIDDFLISRKWEEKDWMIGMRKGLNSKVKRKNFFMV